MSARCVVPLVQPSGALAALAALLLAASYVFIRCRPSPRVENSWSRSVAETVGHTPLLELRTLSAATGRTILAKLEFLNPCGSIKDRPVASMLKDAEQRGVLKPGALIVEPTGGNTGISLAGMALSAGYRLHLTAPSGMSEDKTALLRQMGAEVTLCDSSLSIADAGHFVNVAFAIAKAQGGVVLNQFDNLANMRAHQQLGEEIWSQTGGRVSAFVAAAGTGGTIAGVSRALKQHSPSVRAFIIDPPGSGIKSYMECGVWEPSPGGKTTTDGIGIMRPTANLSAALCDGVFSGSDREATEMAYYVLRKEGLFVGPSSALNLCGAVKAARLLPPGAVVVTVACDGGERYRSKTFSQAWLEEHQLTPRAGGGDLSFVG